MFSSKSILVKSILTNVAISILGGKLNVIDVTIPKFPPPHPLKAQNKSSFTSLLQTIKFPLLSINSASTNLSHPNPKSLAE